MQLRNVRRRVAVLAVAAAAAVAAIAAPTAAQAHHGHRPGWLILSPTSGLLTDNPIADYSTTKPCPANHRAVGAVALEGGDGTPLFVGGNFVPTTTPPSGTLNSTSLRSVVLANDLTTGYYELGVYCFNDDYTSYVTANRTWIKIDVEAGTWRRVFSWAFTQETK
ncbi:hypothetical protein ACN27F_17035 [Solwaraspora sp. WMMB335]|uniref:hypothetical protein n=1 Tax=Solwaraspora sp. WMMB335 TaxID=3404118 RepID=UPI003B936368